MTKLYRERIESWSRYRVQAQFPSVNTVVESRYTQMFAYFKIIYVVVLAKNLLSIDQIPCKLTTSHSLGDKKYVHNKKNEPSPELL